MESHRTPSGRRILLPAEVQLCNVLGITEEEYWYFVELTESYNGKRPPAYDLIPDIVNMPPVTIAPFVIGGVSIGFWGVVAIGAALTAVSAMLAPKIRAPKFDTPETLKTADAQGAKRFAPQSSFNSVQQLAILGDVVPLVFTNRVMNPGGGIRVSSKLLWSQMRSLFTGQQLRGLFLFSSGELGARPDYEGFAIGDTTLANYTEAKVALYFMPAGGRPKESVIDQRYSKGTLEDWPDDDAFSVHWDRDGDYNRRIFSGTRTPGTQTQFGAFSPFPNSMKFMVPYELVLKSKDAKADVKSDIDKKRNKIATSFPRYASFVQARKADGELISTANRLGNVRSNISKGDEVDYKIYATNPQEQFKEFDPWGVEDVKSSVDSCRITADTNLAKGDTYLIGDVLATCERVAYSPDTGIWTPTNSATVTATFKALEDGKVDVKDSNHAYYPWETLTLQRCAIATVSNNTSCEVTEIGIKSTVWKQVTGFANVNSHPGHIQYGEEGTVKKYEDDNGGIQLGAMSKYIKRLSFFRLQAKGMGEEEWSFIDGGIPFLVKGNTPQPQYNFIRIVHSNSPQCEFRLLPYPGNLALENFKDRDVHMFMKNRPHGRVDLPSGDYDVYYSGQLTRLTGALMSNTEWYLGALPEQIGSEVIELSHKVEGSIPTHKDWVKVVDDAYSETRSTWNAEGENTWCSDYMRVRYWIEGRRGSSTGKLDFDYPGTQYMNESRTTAEQTHWRYKIDEYFPRAGYHDHLIDGSPNWKPWYVHTHNPNLQFRVGSFVYKSGQYPNAYVFKIHKYTMQDVNDAAFNIDENVATTNVQGGGRGGNGLTLKVTVYKNNAVEWSIKNPGSGYHNGDIVKFNYPKNGGGTGSISCTVETASAALVTDDPWPIGRNLNSYDAIADYYQYDAEQSSHLSNPEHEIVYVNEQRSNSHPIDYDNLAIAGLRLNSAKEWSSFSQLSAYIKEGVKVKRLIKDNGETAPDWYNASTNLFPEIAYALLTDKEIGAGELIGVTSVDKEKMTVAAKFCKANGFFWDGVITQSQNLREFIFAQAAYCFLDFTIIGGRFSLYPSVPFNTTDFVIDPEAKPPIKALFTDGNIKDLKVSFLSPEERQVFQARVLWRKEKENGFPETKVAEVRLAKVQSNGGSTTDIWTVGSDVDPVETFDMSVFCTSDKHAVRFAKYALRTRQLVDHGLTFQTTPQAAMFLNPGDYFRLYSESTHTSRFSNGVITEGGVIQSQKTVSNGNSIYYWKPGQEEVDGPTPIIISDGLAADAFRGCVFTIAETNSSDRVYKVESLTFAEDGLVEVAGSYVPLTKDGYVAVLHQVYDSGVDSEDFDEST